jgi:spore coat polysaccharide biosynthesis protein SpsF
VSGCGAIILARMASARLPGKVLRELAGKPLLDHVIDRARRIRAASRLVVATSTEPGDDAIVEHAANRGVTVFRGSHDDVAGRILGGAEAHRLEFFARI